MARKPTISERVRRLELRITSRRIASRAVTGSKIARMAIARENIAPEAVSRSRIADGAISVDKLAPRVVRTIDAAAATATSAITTVQQLVQSGGPAGPAGRQGATGPAGPAGPAGLGCIEPLPIATQIVYVNKAGNDATADGSECKPFLTVTAAMASIIDASPTKRYAISIGPGTYTEPLIHLKANVQLVGTSTLLTRLAIPFDINDPSWFETNFQNDNRSGFVDLTLLTGPLDFNFFTISSFSGKLFFVSVNITPTPTFTAKTTSVNQINIRDSMLAAGYTQNGIFMVMSFIRL